MNGITIHEFDVLVPGEMDASGFSGLRVVPAHVCEWLQSRCLDASGNGGPAWVRLVQRQGKLGIQVTSYVGVIRAPDGFQIEVLPKVGKAIAGGTEEARKLLLRMLRCMDGFRHIHRGTAEVLAERMPILEIFIAEFLSSVGHVLKRGIRKSYVACVDNRPYLQGKLKIARHLQQNLCRADRFHVEFDELITNRPENRLIRSALRRVLSSTSSQSSQQFGRELLFAFSEIPESGDFGQDFQRVQLDRGMSYYADALAWARLILNEFSPLTGRGAERAPSLLFPMEAVFEAYVTKMLLGRVAAPFRLKPQVQSRSLVTHEGQHWFRLKPDLLIQRGTESHLVLDTKWKLLDGSKSNGTDKYGLAQGDFYQLQAYGQNYLDGNGNLILIYPRTDLFNEPLPSFLFSRTKNLRLWVLPFCLTENRLLLPDCEDWNSVPILASALR